MQEIVIKLTDDMYQAVKDGTWCGNELWWNALKNGVPLPKGHGRLIDADNMKTIKNIQSANFNAVELIRLWIDKQDTIIEAEEQ